VSLTPSQVSAIQARGNVLIVAGAGTGKTRTLVERCLSLVLDETPPVDIDEILMVTFTEAAAAEMRKRIRSSLEQKSNGTERHRCAEQLALMDVSHIGTLHSFCLKLIRQHFYELEVDPQVSVMREEEAFLLASETLDKLLRELYAGKSELAESVRQLVRIHGGASDESIRRAILDVHNYLRTLADSSAWLTEQSSMLAETEPRRWRQWLLDAIPHWREEWLEYLEEIPKENCVAQGCIAVLNKAAARPDEQDLAVILRDLTEAFNNCQKGKNGAWLGPLERFQDEVSFLQSLDPGGSTTPTAVPCPLEADWQWTRLPLLALLQVTSEFSKHYAEEKRELAVVDFQDLEQHTLRLLWNAAENKPTAIANDWRERLRHIVVDEYQDINAAQDRIIQALSREGSNANRFLVGDVKQSIYRFRLASPGIFRGYMQTWKGALGVTIPLVENFRSRAALLNLTNSIFRRIMPASLGGIDYDTQALQFGAPKERAHLDLNPNDPPAAELHLRMKVKGQTEEVGEGAENVRSEIQEAEKEALIIASRLRDFHREQTPVWDEAAGSFRPVHWMDMAILLRAPSRKSESYAKAFARLNVPLQVAKRGFYDSIEISDLIGLLQILDNPLQDVPLIGVLLSPFANIELNEIAEIRLAAKKVGFWNVLVTWHRAARTSQNGDAQATLQKVDRFLERMARWRSLARQAALSTFLETILAETCYCEWLQVQSRGPQRHANVERFVGLAREFDRFQKRGLLRFLAYVDAQKEAEAEPEVAAAGDSDAVRLMSIHQSKGLEFPIVAVPDLAKPFNLSDLRSDLFLSETYGLCSTVRPPHTRRKYPSLPLWLARRAERRELLGEELRLLYVAITRARDRIILSASVSAKDLQKFQSPTPASFATLVGARSCADWLACWAGNSCPIGMTDGANEHLAWYIHEESVLPEFRAIQPSRNSAAVNPGSPVPVARLSPPIEALLQKLKWQYPFLAATSEPAKSSVSVLRRRFAEDEIPANKLFKPLAGNLPLHPGSSNRASPISAAERGSAHHTYLQHMGLDEPGSIRFLREESTRMVKAGLLQIEEARALDLDGIAAFWNSGTGKAILEHCDEIHRELAFTARFKVSELALYVSSPAPQGLDEEFVIIQGVADLAVILPWEIWIVDFKNDQVDEEEIPERSKSYDPQLRIYSDALSRIYGRPTTRSELYFITARASAK
jgi:ATP-dependent helicase/nuclease subunit A